MYNYVRPHRVNIGLTQKELGYLIGNGDNARISKLENGTKTPTLKEIVIFELLFDKAISRIFPDLYTKLANDFLQRLDLFEQHLQENLYSQTEAEKLAAIRKVRHEIAKENEGRI